MKRRVSLGIATVLMSGALASLAIAGWSLYTEQYHEALGSQICTAITSRAQVGGARDSFDQAYAILRISSHAERSFASFRNGQEEYGQHPPEGAAYQSVECRIEGRPDMALTLYFEKAPIFGKAWALTTFVLVVALALLGLALHAVSARIVRIVQSQLSSGMSLVLGGRPRSQGLGRFFDAMLENAPAIRKLKRELEEKRELTTENSAFRSKVSHLLEENSEQGRRERSNAEIVSQVRHDLRSPLSYLKVFGQTINAGNMEPYHLSVQKIDRILQDLNQVAGAEVRLNEPSERCLVECALRESITAKKSLWSRSLEIQFDFSPDSLNVAPVDPVRFGRIIDNILQNAYEAVVEAGKIQIETGRVGSQVVVKISDNGAGIPKEILSRLGSERVTFGKAGGNGIGLQSTKQWIEAWGGSLSIDSGLGRGTTVSIVLPRIDFATRFVADIPVTHGQEIIVVDDDVELGKRLIELHGGGRGQCFPSIASYAVWLDGADLSNDKILSVYDLHLNPGSGLDLLRLHPWPKRAVLYTDDYFNTEALELSAEIGFAIFPKIFLSV